MARSRRGGFRGWRTTRSQAAHVPENRYILSHFDRPKIAVSDSAASYPVKPFFPTGVLYEGGIPSDAVNGATLQRVLQDATHTAKAFDWSVLSRRSPFVVPPPQMPKMPPPPTPPNLREIRPPKLKPAPPPPVLGNPEFGPDAYEFAKDKNITLLDGPNLLHLFKKHGYAFRIDLKEAREIMGLDT